MKLLSRFVVLSLSALTVALGKPNIVLVITDDQGYGDLGCTGNPVIKTPHTDALATESVGLSDYHVAPTCSPTRAALITGHWTDRTGVWHTVNGRSMLRENEVTLGQMLKDDGYETGMFGKWHMGDNYPYRPEDRGFTEVYRHGGGGVGQTPDVWDNAYFDGSYFHNGKIEEAKGFCTDVFFEEANGFIEKSTKEKKPFFAYICTNAPHGPLHCPQKYLDLYKDQPDNIAAFFGMITNIDDNVGKTRALLRDLGIHDNTIFIFTTDNGTASGANVFNAGMRGKKGSAYDGGHRVPFFLHWPGGGLKEKLDVGTITHAVDVVPTLLDLVGAKKPDAVKFDGVSVKALLEGKTTGWPERVLVTDSQRVRDPIKWKDSSVMTEHFRLIEGKELYQIDRDPGQKSDIAEKHPEQVAKMRAFYEAWWAELEPTFAQTTEIVLGHADHPVVSLTGHDWIQKGLPPWNQRHIRSGHANKSKKHEGHWAVKVVTEGNYQISMRRWPQESQQPITAALAAGANVPGATKAFRAVEGKAVMATRATLRLNEKDLEMKPVTQSDQEISFTTKLKVGSHKLAPVFHTKEGELGAYYTIVTKLE
ncbi:MAG: arylsulfatase A-like enzyme [Verrucomicrobiales bacterium]|jgi:arylsulfatase A-like enzyme